jgi:hypothetical protein
MLKDVIGSISKAAGRLLKNWRALLIFLALYLALLAAMYCFVVATGVGTLFQVFLSLALPIIAPIIFFVLQTMAVSYLNVENGPKALLRRSLKDFWKVIVVTVPFVLLAWLIIYLLGKIPLEAAPAAVTPRAGARASSTPTQWPSVLVGAFEFILLFIALPLAAVHLWIAAVTDGMSRMLKGAGRTMIRAFSPGSVLIYLIGLLVFGALPYLLIQNRTPWGGAWVEMSLLGMRLVVAALLVLAGWIITLGALSDNNARGSSTPATS